MKKKSNLLFPVLIICSVLIAFPVLRENDPIAHASDYDTGPDMNCETQDAMYDADYDVYGPITSDGEDPLQEGSQPEESGSEGFPPEESDFCPEEMESTEERTDLQDSLSSKEEFFSDVLFIGDSRTVGLMEYAGLDSADFFATSGMSTFQVLKKEVSVPGVGKMTLSELLKSKSYGKIFLMLGINELGYPPKTVIRQYSHVVETIQGLQPDARLYLCANLHLTAKRSDSDDIYNNVNINTLNEQIAQMADNETSFYLDVNPLFDDENGCLNEDYSADDTHPYGKYYEQWGQWIYETCVR